MEIMRGIMKAMWFEDAAPVAGRQPRGGAAVGMLDELPAVEMTAILLLRHWCDGPEGRSRIVDDFTMTFGPARADQELECFAALMQTVLAGGSRPLMRHGVGCACFGGDESAFAQMMAAAAAGEREDALIFALALMTPAAAFAAVATAEPVGRGLLAFARLLRQTTTSDFTRH
jgi:hypothetical protein